MRNLVLGLCLVLPFAACGGSKPASTETPKTGTPNTETTAPGGACDTFTDCGACVAGGCSWSGKSCADTCKQDVSCYGAGNPAAPTCPDGTEPPEPETF